MCVCGGGGGETHLGSLNEKVLLGFGGNLFKTYKILTVALI